MRFNCRVVWFDPIKNRRQYTDVGPSYAIFIAKKKVAEGMQDVVIQVTGEDGDDPSDCSWPPIDVEVTEINNMTSEMEKSYDDNDTQTKI